MEAAVLIPRTSRSVAAARGSVPQLVQALAAGLAVPAAQTPR